MKKRAQRGFTLMEAVVGTALFVIIAVAAYQAYFSLFQLAAINQYKVIALQLVDEQFEIIRNLPYSNVGITNGIPAGVLPHIQTLTRGGINFTVTTTIRNIDLPFDGEVGSSTKNDLSPADNKLVEIAIDCATCKNFTTLTFTSQVAPKNLETASTNGVLLIKAFDADGNPVSGADVHVVNAQKTPSIIVDDTTDGDGLLQIVDAATGTTAYNITVSKPGYSTDKTYPASSTNPTPDNPYATVLLQQVTPISFSIDKLSTMNVSTINSTCAPVTNVGFSLTGSKTIGAGLPKYSLMTTTDSSGNKTLSNMEWDWYTFGLTGSTYDLAGVNLLNAVALDPDSTQNVQLLVTPRVAKSLLVTVKDDSNLLPITGATVLLTNTSGYSSTKITGQGFFTQSDWMGGAGQANYSTTNRFWAASSSMKVASLGEITLLKTGSSYALYGALESSTFDTGAASNFYSLTWAPANQPIGSGPNSVLMQIAVNATNTATTTWNYMGPDGTSGSYYTSANSTITPNTLQGNERYLRYKLYMSSQSATNTPSISDISFTYAYSCMPPGQVLFSGLTPTTGYTLTVSAPSYDSKTKNSYSIPLQWQEEEVKLPLN